jgi:hypothetical protein
VLASVRGPAVGQGEASGAVLLGCLLHGRRVVDTVPEHRHDLALLPQDVDQAHFVLGVTWAITPRSSIPASASSPVMPPNSAPVIAISIACAPLAGSR